MDVDMFNDLALNFIHGFKDLANRTKQWHLANHLDVSVMPLLQDLPCWPRMTQAEGQSSKIECYDSFTNSFEVDCLNFQIKTWANF